MFRGRNLTLSVYGTSHGPAVGCLLNGVPAGIKIDYERIDSAMSLRKTGGKYASKRKEEDKVEFISGVNEGFTTSEPILITIQNQDGKRKDYSFLPDIPRPGHQDMLMNIRSSGNADLSGGGSSSARLTAGIVAAGALLEQVLIDNEVKILAQVSEIGEIKATSLDAKASIANQEVYDSVRCYDEEAGYSMMKLLDEVRREKDSIGSKVEALICNMPIAQGGQWFDGLESTFASAMMAIPAARGVEFSKGFDAVRMKGSEHNNAWIKENGKITQEGENPDGIIAGLTTGSPIRIGVAFKPPSSIAKAQNTLNLDTGEVEELQVKGRHDPVIAPRAVAVVRAMSILVVSDYLI